MRVAFITNLAPHYRRPLYERLARRHEVDYFFASMEGEWYFNSNLKHQHGDFNTPPVRSYRILGHPLMPGLVRVLKRDRYDVVVKCLNGRLMVPFTVLVSRMRGLPVVIWTGNWVHPDTTFHRLTRFMTEAVYRNADALLAYGDHVRAFLAEVPGVDPGKIFVPGQATDPTRFEAVSPVPTEVPEFVYVGQFEERKGVDVLLDAFQLLPQGIARLVLVGSGSQEAELRERASRIPGVEMAGYVPQEDLPERLARSRALVLPSVRTRSGKEPWGFVVNEAMHAGVPTVVTETVGAAAGGLVVDGRNGRVVPERDARALAEALRGLADDSERAAAMGVAARTDVERFNYDTMVDRFEAAMQHAVDARRRGPAHRRRGSVAPT
jgi:glycosyltransferase involved in cell wall biosynthesis